MTEPRTKQLQAWRRILRILLLLTATGWAAAGIFLFLWRGLADRETDLVGREGRLLAQEELQELLLADGTSDHVAYPHVVREISFVLNRAAKQATWRAAPGSEYRINRLGLRGEEIGLKSSRQHRLVLLGDSVLFGWKLSDEERLEGQLEVLLGQYTDAPPQVVTIALPGWNTLSESAFLRHHLGLLDPDLVFWVMLNNDIAASPGVAPPGVLAGFAAPQAIGPMHLGGFEASRSRLDMPRYRELWDRALDPIVRLERDFDFPIIVTDWRIERPFMDALYERHGWPAPTESVFRVPEDDRSDSRWALSASDAHPTSWALRRVALGLIDRMANLGWFEEPDWKPEDFAVVEAYRRAATLRTTPAQQLEYASSLLGEVPRDFSCAGKWASLCGSSGLELPQRGFLLLRTQRSGVQKKRLVALRLRLDPRVVRASRGVRLEVRNRAGEVVRQELPVAPEMNLKLEAPPIDAEVPLLELRWDFDVAECRTAIKCVAAELIEVGVGPAD